MKVNLPRRLLIEELIDQLSLKVSRARNNLITLAEDLGEMKKGVLLLYTQNLDATAAQLKSIVERVNVVLEDTTLPSQVDASAAGGLVDQLAALGQAVVDVEATRPDATWKLLDIRDWMTRREPPILHEETDTVEELLTRVRQAGR